MVVIMREVVSRCQCSIASAGECKAIVCCACNASCKLRLLRHQCLCNAIVACVTKALSVQCECNTLAQPVQCECNTKLKSECFASAILYSETSI